MGALYRSEADESTLRRWCAGRLEAWETPHDRREIDTVLGATHLTSVGAGADVCVYLPGTNFNAATSTRLLAALAEHLRVVCVDLPGQPGLSTADRPRDDSASTRWLTEVLDSCRNAGGRVVVAGHSRGAALALTAPPEAVDALVLLSPAGLARVHLTPSLLVRSTAWVLRPGDRTSARLVDLMAGGHPLADTGLLVEWMTLVARTSRTTGAPGPLPPDQLDQWQHGDVRVLVGEHDAFFPPERLEGRVRKHLGARLEVVPSAGHLLVDQRADAVVAAVLGA